MIKTEELPKTWAWQLATLSDSRIMSAVDGVYEAAMSIEHGNPRIMPSVKATPDGIFVKDQARIHVLDNTISNNSGHGIHAESADNIEECLRNIITDNGLGNFAGSSDEVARQVAQKCGS